MNKVAVAITGAFPRGVLPIAQPLLGGWVGVASSSPRVEARRALIFDKNLKAASSERLLGWLCVA